MAVVTVGGESITRFENVKPYSSRPIPSSGEGMGGGWASWMDVTAVVGGRLG